MKIKDKIEVFQRFAIEVAKQEGEASVNACLDSCGQELEAFRKAKHEDMERQFKIEESRIRRQMNREVSREMLRQKHMVDDCSRKWQEKLMGRVRELLAEYQGTGSYLEYLAAKIRMAQQVAGEDEVTIYINPSDAGKKEFLERETGARLTVSSIEFGGGIRAVIRSRNLLIDESFVTKLEQEEACL
ncbi:hypothetical protein AALC25_11400 [Lachnospiraceae bacterium 29-84]